MLRLLGNVQLLGARNWFRSLCDFSMKYALSTGECFGKCDCQNDIHWFQKHTHTHNTLASVLSQCGFWMWQINRLKFSHWIFAICQKHLWFFRTNTRLSLGFNICTHVHYQLSFFSKTIKYENKIEQLHRTRFEYQIAKLIYF